MLASHNSMQKKNDKVGNKTANKEGKKKAREKDRNRFAKKSPNLDFCACVKSKKAV